jgi:acetyl esterase/lipase
MPLLRNAVILSLCLSSSAGFSQTAIPQDVELLRDVEFGKAGARTLRMHILRPRTPPRDPMPTLVYIHGGGWVSDSTNGIHRKESAIKHLIPFARAGFCCASIEYRLSTEAVFPAQIEDCKCAIRFLRAKARVYNLDVNRIGVWGSSAGGHLAALLGTTGGVEEFEGNGGWPQFSSRVQAVCDFYGPTDFLSVTGKDAELLKSVRQLLGGLIKENRSKASKASPITYAAKDAPPFLIVHGDRDTVVPISQSQSLYNVLKRQGIDVELRVVKGAGHGLLASDEGSRELARAFFERHLVRSSGMRSGAHAGGLVPVRLPAPLAHAAPPRLTVPDHPLVGSKTAPVDRRDARRRACNPSVSCTEGATNRRLLFLTLPAAIVPVTVRSQKRHRYKFKVRT